MYSLLNNYQTCVKDRFKKEGSNPNSRSLAAVLHAVLFLLYYHSDI